MAIRESFIHLPSISLIYAMSQAFAQPLRLREIRLQEFTVSLEKKITYVLEVHLDLGVGVRRQEMSIEDWAQKQMSAELSTCSDFFCFGFPVPTAIVFGPFPVHIGGGGLGYAMMFVMVLGLGDLQVFTQE